MLSDLHATPADIPMASKADAMMGLKFILGLMRLKNYPIFKALHFVTTTKGLTYW